MGDLVVFHTKEEQEILRNIADKENEKAFIIANSKNLRKEEFLDIIDDINFEIEELLKDLDTKVKENQKRSISNKKILSQKGLK